MNEPLLLDAYGVHLRSRRMAERTVTTYLAIAIEFLNGLRLLGGTGPTRADVERFLARPRRDGAPRAPSSINQSLAAIRALARVAREREAWATDPTSGITMLREPARDPRFATRDELTRLFRAAAEQSESTRARTLALLATFVTSGLRVHEVARLNIAQLDLVTSTLLDVVGKGGTRHDQALPPVTTKLLERWFAVRNALAKPNEMALFVSQRGTRWSVRGMQRCIAELGVAAALAKPIHCHALRHSVGTLGLSLGLDLTTIADVLRHADLSSTRRYVHLGDERRRAAALTLGRLVPLDVWDTPDDTKAGQEGDVPINPTLDTKGDLDDTCGMAA